jgi:hypothetical protein
MLVTDSLQDGNLIKVNIITNQLGIPDYLVNIMEDIFIMAPGTQPIGNREQVILDLIAE